VDGYHPATKPVFQTAGEIINLGQTRENHFLATAEKKKSATSSWLPHRREMAM